MYNWSSKGHSGGAFVPWLDTIIKRRTGVILSVSCCDVPCCAVLCGVFCMPGKLTDPTVLLEVVETLPLETCTSLELVLRRNILQADTTDRIITFGDDSDVRTHAEHLAWLCVCVSKLAAERGNLAAAAAEGAGAATASSDTASVVQQRMNKKLLCLLLSCCKATAVVSEQLPKVSPAQLPVAAMAAHAATSYLELAGQQEAAAEATGSSSDQPGSSSRAGSSRASSSKANSSSSSSSSNATSEDRVGFDPSYWLAAAGRALLECGSCLLQLQDLQRRGPLRGSSLTAAPAPEAFDDTCMSVQGLIGHILAALAMLQPKLALAAAAAPASLQKKLASQYSAAVSALQTALEAVPQAAAARAGLARRTTAWQGFYSLSAEHHCGELLAAFATSLCAAVPMRCCCNNPHCR